jgi:hypothetical protein
MRRSRKPTASYDAVEARGSRAARGHPYRVLGGRSDGAEIRISLPANGQNQAPSPAAAILQGDEIDFRKAEIIENLHRAELTALERSEWEAALVKLCEEEAPEVQSGQVDPIESKRVDGRGHRPEGGISQAARELKKPDESDEAARSRIRRSTKIAAAAPEAKEAATAAGLANNQRALLEIAKEPTPEAQVAKVAPSRRRWIGHTVTAAGKEGARAGGGRAGEPGAARRWLGRVAGRHIPALASPRAVPPLI